MSTPLPGSFRHGAMERWAKRQSLLKKSNTAYKRALNLRSQANALTPACRIPAEVLVEIFKCDDLAKYTGDACIFLGIDRPYGLELGWILVTHVCRYWREVALHSQALWANIVPFNEHTVSVCVCGTSRIIPSDHMLEFTRCIPCIGSGTVLQRSLRRGEPGHISQRNDPQDCCLL